MSSQGQKSDIIRKKKGGRKIENYHRHDISDEAWAKIEDKLPGKRGMWGGIATRYIKNAASFLATIHIRCTALAISNS